MLINIAMVERKFVTKLPDFISCDIPCEELCARTVMGNKVKGVTTPVSKRCIAQGASLRGQHYSLKTGHENNLKACRICTIYTEMSLQSRNVIPIVRT